MAISYTLTFSELRGRREVVIVKDREGLILAGAHISQINELPKEWPRCAVEESSILFGFLRSPKATPRMDFNFVLATKLSEQNTACAQFPSLHNVKYLDTVVNSPIVRYGVRG
jgi:hypothetical protein